MCKLAGQMVSWWIVVAMAMAVFKHDGVDGVFTETCSSTSSNCTALVSYTAPANSTLAIVTALFGVSDIDSLLGANDFNLSTPATLALSPGDFLKVPVTCNCINGTRLSNSTIYEVVAGDTLTVIAEETYQGLITYQQIAAANGIVDVNYIQIGQSLVITFPCGCNPFADQPVVYLAYPVQSGDSIANISADFGAQMADVLSLNGIANASDLQVGSVLEVPIPACQASFLQSSIDSGLLVAEGGYELTAAKCVQCICTDALQLRCIPTPTSFNNACLESLQCANSILTIGNFTASRSSTGCDVTSCIYEGYTQGKTISSQVVHSTENQCPVVAPWTYDIPAPIGTYPTPGPTSGAPARIIIVIEVIVPVTVVTFLIAMVVFFLYWSTRKEKLSLLFQIQEEFAKQDVQPTLYAYNDIKIATRDFHPDMKIGQGSFGVVYKGTLQNGGEVAVKHLLTNSQQSIDEFLNEVVLITNVKHKNLVKLKGCCLMGGGGANKRYLVYEFVDNNNLAETIFENKGGHNVDWPIRKNICLGVARGLNYLHQDAQPRIIHRDIKAANILLDKHFNAKIVDFGLARLFPDTSTHISTFHIAGTMGYVAPEYASRGQLSEKVDVFSFGVLVLEIVSGRKNIEPNLNENQTYLLEWVWKLYEEAKLLEIVDPKMNTHNHEKDIIHVINIGLLCVQSTSSKRPSMARIVTMLQGDEMEMEVVIKETPLKTLEYESLLTTINSSSMSGNTLKEAKKVVLQGKTIELCNK